MNYDDREPAECPKCCQMTYGAFYLIGHESWCGSCVMGLLATTEAKLAVERARLASQEAEIARIAVERDAAIAAVAELYAIAKRGPSDKVRGWVGRVFGRIKGCPEKG